MEKIDTEKLRLFHHQLSALNSDCEENWYLIKRILSEMDMDEYFDSPQVFQELHDALEKLELMMEVFSSMKNITSTLANDYEAMMTRHQTSLNNMIEYAQGFKSSYRVLSDERQAKRVDVAYTNTAPITASIYKAIGKVEVVEDE